MNNEQHIPYTNTKTYIVYKITVIGERLRMYGKLYRILIYAYTMYHYCIVIVHMHIIYNIYSDYYIYVYIHLLNIYVLFMYMI